MRKMSRREMMTVLASAAGLAVLGQQSNAPNHAPPMSEQEVKGMKGLQGKDVPGIAHAKPKYDRGDRIRIKDGTFGGMEGEIEDTLEAHGLVRVKLTIYGRPVPVELEYWHLRSSTGPFARPA